MTNGKAPVVFIHGLWLPASSWEPWLDLFTEAGYRTTAHTKSAVKQYRHSTAVTDLEEFDRGHSLTIDGGWRAVASECLTWLAKQGL
jgi:pimeloyl-ACP methyl ester carboxylesterase